MIQTTMKMARAGGPSIALALAIVLAGSGCATARPANVGPPDHVFKITFAANGCPQSATPVGGSNCGVGSPPSCLVARRNDTVAFQADPGSPEFAVTFDPFSPPLTVPAGQNGVSKPIHPLAPYTTYKFSVASGACPVLDPIIIVNR